MARAMRTSAIYPNFPGFLAVGVAHCLPAVHGYGIAGDRFNGDAESPPDLARGSASRDVYISGGDGQDHALPVIADHLDGILRAAGPRRPSAVIPNERSDEDEDKNQRHHHVVMEGAARMSPVEIALQDAAEAVPGLPNGSASAGGFHQG